MGLGHRRGRAARHHHRRHHRNHHHHHGHARVNLGGMFFRGAGGGGGNHAGYMIQRRMLSGFIMIMVGLPMFLYGAVTTGISSSYSRFGYSYQGTIFMGIGAVLTLTGVILTVKMYHMYRAQRNANAQGQGSTVVVQSGSGVTTTSNMQLQQNNTGNVWMTGQSGSVPPPPPGYGPPQQGYPMGYPQGAYPPAGQPMYPYNQPPPVGGVPPPAGVAPPPQMGVEPQAPPQPWQAQPGMQPAPTSDGTQPQPQLYQVQPAYPPQPNMTAPQPVDASGTQAPPIDDAPPPSYDEATKTQHIP